MFGKGRVALWCAGAITTRDLLSQRGETLSVTELQQTIREMKEPRDFIASAIGSPRDKQSALPLDWVSDAAAEKVKALGIDVTGKRISLDHDSVIHVHKSHGNAAVELPRGQAPINADDIAGFAEMFNRAELRAGEPPVAGDGAKLIAGEVEMYGWRYSFVAKVRKKDVVPYTIWKRKGRTD